MNFFNLSFISYFGIFFNTRDADANIAIAFSDYWNFFKSGAEETISYIRISILIGKIWWTS